MKVGCNIAAVGVSSVIDGIQFVSSKKKNHELYKSKLITKAEYYARVGEDASKRTGGILFGSALGIVSQIVIPIPIVGGCLGGFCGDFLGRKLGKYIGKQIAWGGWADSLDSAEAGAHR